MKKITGKCIKAIEFGAHMALLIHTCANGSSNKKIFCQHFKVPNLVHQRANKTSPEYPAGFSILINILRSTSEATFMWKRVSNWHKKK